MPDSSKGRGLAGTADAKSTSVANKMPLAQFVRHLRNLGVELRAKNDKLQLSAPAGAITPALQEELRERKAELLQWLTSEDSSEEECCAPLTFAQERLWLIDRFAPETAAYNIPQSWMIDSALNVEAFQRSLDLLAERHQTLRTRIEIRNGDPVQVVMKRVKIPLQYTDLAGDGWSEQRESDVKERLRQEGREPFDLGHAPLIRFHIFRLATDRFLVSYEVHHIIADQWSLDVLKRDLAALYLAVTSDAEAQLLPLALQYAEVAERERSSATSQRHAEQLEYWRKRLEGMPTLLELPFAKTRPQSQTYAGATLTLSFDERLTHELRRLAARDQATLYMLMLTAFYTLLYRYTGESDLCVGTPVTGRKMREEEELIGLFVNMLPLRCNVGGTGSFRQLLKRVNASALMDFEHGDIPFQKLVMELHPRRSSAYSPLFQVMFAFNPKGLGEGPEQEETLIGVSKFDLTLQVAERANTLDAYLEYRTDMFAEADMEQFGRHFVQLVRSLVDAPDQAVGALRLLTREDSEAFIRWNSTELSFDRALTLVDLFERQVIAAPDAIALCCGASTYSFIELKRRADRLATLLQAEGAFPGVFVALCVGRSADLIVAMLGILKSGAAYLPLDPKYPEDRLAYMLADSGARILITQRDEAGEKMAADNAGLTVLFADEVMEAGADEMETELHERAEAGDAAYLIYTSGSTGKPKGVVVEHGNAVALMMWAASSFASDSLRGVLASTSVCFDLSIFEIFLPLSTGNTIVLVDDVLELARSPLASKVTLVNTVPSAMNALMPMGLPASVRTVCMAGEFLPTELVDRVYAAGVERVFDLYGPTETTTYSTCVMRERGGVATIGRPIANTSIYLLDENLSQVPPGALGEIFIGGGGVTRGYLNRPELTAERYLEIEPYGRMYRTGDLARHLSDGSLVFMGRRDQQIKLRGFRIELGEVEAALRDASERSQVAVVVQKREAGEVLIAFVTDDTATPLDAKKWMDEIRKRLPAYMLPAAIVPIATMPLTPNGKIDRKALASRAEQVVRRRSGTDDTYAPPRDLLEQWLANIWGHRLGVSRVDRGAHFFEELGGHSLAAFEIFAEIEARLGVAMMLATLFQAPTIALLAAAIRREGWTSSMPLTLLAAAEADGATNRVVYLLSQKHDAKLDEVRSAGERVMEVAVTKMNSSSRNYDRLVMDIESFEVGKPALVLDAESEDRETAQRFRLSLMRAGFASVTLRTR